VHRGLGEGGEESCIGGVGRRSLRSICKLFISKKIRQAGCRGFTFCSLNLGDIVCLCVVRDPICSAQFPLAEQKGVQTLGVCRPQDATSGALGREALTLLQDRCPRGRFIEAANPWPECPR
jgi:hypothetical protein